MLSTTREIGAQETSNLVSEAQNRINSINNQIQRLEVGSTADQHIIIKNNNNNEFWDWTESYDKWSSWNKLEVLQEQKQTEEIKLQSLYEKQEAFAHNHDHTIEKQFFTQPEIEKYRACERHFTLGQYLFEEGLYLKAVENFEVAIAYYEYCFPEESNPEEQGLQDKLDTIREESFLYLVTCFVVVQEYRKAIDSANHILIVPYTASPSDTTHSSDNAHNLRLDRARLQRAIAYRYLDEYDLAKKDLQVLQAKYNRSASPVEFPEIVSVVEDELVLLQQLEDSYMIASKAQFGGILQQPSNGTGEQQGQEEARRAHRQGLSVFHSSKNNQTNQHQNCVQSLPLDEYMPLEPCI